MNFQYMIKNINIMQLDENHDVSKFISNYEDADKFLKEEALELQNTQKSRTMLIIFKGEIIGFYTTGLIDINHENKIYKDIISSGVKDSNLERLVLAELARLTVHKKYDKKKFTLSLFGKVYGTIKLTLRALTTDEPIAVVVNPNCNIPATHEEVIRETEKVNAQLRHPEFMDIKKILTEE